MPIHNAIWRVGVQPERLPDAVLPSEKMLEDMIVAAPSILSDEWMLVGQQEETGHGGRIDLLAMAPDGSLVLVELKRDRTPREVVAQALDYASWVEGLRPEDVAAIYGRFAPGRELSADFKARFGAELDEDALNQSHQIVIVAASLDPSSERIVGYLNSRDVPINVLTFQVFALGDQQLVSRFWLLDPVQVQVSAAAPGKAQEKEPWNGEFYASFGHGPSRNWAEARAYGFISAGGGAWYSRTLKLLNMGDRVWVKAPDYGFVGVGVVQGPAQLMRDFRVQTPEGERPAEEVLTGANYHREFIDDPERAEWFVQITWAATVPIEQAVAGTGLFGNTNTICKPTTPKWRSTVDRLKVRFGVE